MRSPIATQLHFLFNPITCIKSHETPYISSSIWPSNSTEPPKYSLHSNAQSDLPHFLLFRTQSTEPPTAAHVLPLPFECLASSALTPSKSRLGNQAHQGCETLLLPVATMVTHSLGCDTVCSLRGVCISPLTRTVYYTPFLNVSPLSSVLYLGDFLLISLTFI